MVSVAVVGAGAMGMNHLRVYQKIGARVVAAVDPDPARRRDCEERYGVPGAADLAEVLAHPEVDAVSIAAPTSMHHAVARQALQAGKHVLVEKPIARTPEEARDLIRLADEAGLVLAVGHVERHNPAVRMARDMLQEGVLGDLLSLAARRVGGINKRIQDVGVILDLAIHDIDVMRYLTGSEVSSVHAVAGGPAGGHEDRAHITLEFRNGMFGSVDVNWLSPTKVRRLSATCTRAYLDVDYIRQQVSRSTAQLIDSELGNLYQVPSEYESHLISIENREPLALELADFLRAVETKTEPLVTGRDGHAALEAAHAALRSVQEQRRIELDA